MTILKMKLLIQLIGKSEQASAHSDQPQVQAIKKREPQATQRVPWNKSSLQGGNKLKDLKLLHLSQVTSTKARGFSLPGCPKSWSF